MYADDDFSSQITLEVSDCAFICYIENIHHVKYMCNAEIMDAPWLFAYIMTSFLMTLLFIKLHDCAIHWLPPCLS